MDFYTYLHRKADTNEPFYVGKGRRKDRMKLATGRSEHWTRTAQKHGFVPEVVAYWETEAEAFNHERRLIADYRAMGIALCNHTDGGDGASGNKQSDATKEKKNAKLRGQKKSLETIARMRIAQSNKVISESQKAKLSAYWMGRSVGRNNPFAKRCACKDTGKVFDTYTQAGDWLRSIGHVKASFKSISAVISGEKKTAYGYRFVRAD